MTTNTHGGPRPKQRDDDARGHHHSPKPGSGRKPQSFTIKANAEFAVWQRNPEGRPVGLGELWTVKEITRTGIVLVSESGYVYDIRR